MLYAEGRPMRIGMVGTYQVGIETRWAWYCLIREERNFMRDTPTAGSAAKRILRQLADKLSDEEIGGYLSMHHSA
jgi:hypothetical protein